MRVYHTSHQRPSGECVTILSVEDGLESALTAILTYADGLAGMPTIELTYHAEPDKGLGSFELTEQRMLELMRVTAVTPVSLELILGPGAMYLDEQTLGRALMQIAQGI